MAPMVTADTATETETPPSLLTPPKEAAKEKEAKPPKEKPPEKEKGSEIEEDKESTARGGSAALLKLKNAQEMETKAWLDAISGEAAIKVSLIRREPKEFRDRETGDTVKVDGTLKVYDRAIDEEEVQRTHGGGTYQITVKTKNAAGQWQYFGAKTFEIAGDPDLRSLPRAHAPPKDSPTVVIPQKDPAEGRFMDKMGDFLIAQATGAGRPAAVPQVVHQGLDSATMQAIVRPLELQIQSLTALLAAKDAEIARVRETAGKDPFRDKMLDTLMDGDSARLTALRTNHESEIRQLKEGFRQDLERERDRHLRDVERMEKAHEREIAGMKQSHEQAIALATQKGDITKMVLDREVSTLEKQLDANRTELAALRAKKEMTIKEKVEELAAIKELVGDDSDEEEQGTVEKIIGAIGNIPVLTKLAENKLGGGAPVQQAAQHPQQPEQRVVRDKTTGQVSLRKADGTMIPLRKAPVSVTTADGHQIELPPVDPEQVKQAITFMESAYRSNTPPDQFAASARPFMTDAMLGAMRTLGITEFLTKVGKVNAASPLATMRGRQWTKKVAAALLGEGEGSDAPPAPAEAAQEPVATE